MARYLTHFTAFKSSQEIISSDDCRSYPAASLSFEGPADGNPA